MNKLIGSTPMKQAAIIAGLLLIAGHCSAGTLKLLLTGGENPAMTKFISAYQKSHKGTTISPIYLDWQNQSVAIEKKPDVFMGWSDFITDNIEIDMFENLSKYLPGNTFGKFVPEFVESGMIGKKVICIPVGGYCNYLAYNKTAFSQVGLDKPSASWSWQNQFYQACKKLSRDTNGDGRLDQHGIVGLPGNDLATLIYSFGGRFIDKGFKKVVYTEKPSMDAINFILKLHNEKLAELVDWDSYNQDDISTWPFTNGKSAMRIQWGTSFDTTGENKWLKSKGVKWEIGYSVIPKGPKGAVPAVTFDVATIMKTSKNKKAAAEFVKYMADTKGQSMLFDSIGELPTTYDGLRYKNVTAKADKPFLKSYQNGRARSIRKQTWQVEGTLWRDLQNILTGDGTMKDLVDNAKGSASEALTNSFYSY